MPKIAVQILFRDFLMLTTSEFFSFKMSQKKMPEKASVLQFLRDLWTSGWRWIHWNVEYSLRSRIGASIERFNGSSVNQRFKNVPKITQQTKITPLNKSRYPPQMIFEETFSAIQTDIKDFEFEIPNDGLSRIAETRISDLKQKQHKKWNLDFLLVCTVSHYIEILFVCNIKRNILIGKYQ